jgi:outer membrane protein assembly factor BamB
LLLTRVVLLSAVLTALFACSSEEVNPPAELEAFTESAYFLELWDTSVGSGDEDLRLALEPFIFNDVIYTVDVEGVVYALSLDNGEPLWESELEFPVSGGLSGDGRHLYMASFQGELIALNRESGEEVWRSMLSSESLSPVSSNGARVVVQTSDGGVSSLSVDSGEQRWRYASVAPLLSLRGTSAPQISGDQVIASFANGSLLSLDLASGLRTWETKIGQPQGRTELERLVDVDGYAAIQRDRLYTVSYQGKMMSLDLSSGSEIWSLPFSSYHGPAVGFNHLVAVSDDGKVHSLNKRNATSLWVNEQLLNRRVGAPTIWGDYVAVADFEGYIHLLNIETGEFAARIRPDSDGVMGRMLVSNDKLIVYTRSGDLVAYTLKN